MELLRLMGLCVICLLPVLLLRQKAPEQALLLTLTVLSAAVVCVLSAASPLLERLGQLFDRAGVDSAHTAALLKTAAAAAVSRLCADLCRDGGSQALASGVELAGAAAALLILLPLLEDVVELLLGCFG